MILFFVQTYSPFLTWRMFGDKVDFNVIFLNCLLMTCAVAGDATFYFIGWKLGPALFRREDSMLFKKRHLIAMHHFYERHGGKTMIIARFVPFIGNFAPVVAGMAKMSIRRFAVFNIIGAIALVSSMMAIGYALDNLFPETQKHIHLVIAVVIFLSALPAVVDLVTVKSSRISKCQT